MNPEIEEAMLRIINGDYKVIDIFDIREYVHLLEYKNLELQKRLEKYEHPTIIAPVRLHGYTSKGELESE